MQRILSIIAHLFLPVILPAVPLIGLVFVGQEQLGQSIVSAAVIGIACALLGLTLLLSRRSLRASSAAPLFAFIGVPLFIASIVSWVSADASSGFTSIFGQGNESGTVASYALIALCVALCARFGRHVGGIFLQVFLAISSIISLCALLLWLGLSAFAPLSAIATHVSFTLAAASVVAALLFDARQGQRAVYAAVSLMSLVGLFVFFHPVAAIAAIGVSLACIAYTAFSKDRSLAIFPLATLVVGAALSLMLIFGLRSPQVEVPIDIRPSILATGYIIGPEYLSSVRTAIFGTGPDSLSYAWNLYRPVEFNTGSRWDVTPTSTYSTALTMAIELGILGLCAFLLMPAALLYRLAVTRRGALDEGAALAALALFVFGSALVYTVELPFILLGAFALSLALLSRKVPPPEEHREVRVRVAAISMTLLLALGSFFVVIGVLQALAWQLAEHGRAAMGQNDLVSAKSAFNRAITVWPEASYLRDGSLAYAWGITAPMGGGGAFSTLTRAMRDDTVKAVSFAERAAKTRPHDFSFWLFKGSLYMSLAQIGYDGAKENAQASFLKAKTLAPTRPDILYMHALFYVSAGELPAAKDAAQRSLTLKPNYEEAAVLLRDLTTRLPGS